MNVRGGILFGIDRMLVLQGATVLTATALGPALHSFAGRHAPDGGWLVAAIAGLVATAGGCLLAGQERARFVLSEASGAPTRPVSARPAGLLITFAVLSASLLLLDVLLRDHLASDGLYAALVLFALRFDRGSQVAGAAICATALLWAGIPPALSDSAFRAELGNAAFGMLATWTSAWLAIRLRARLRTEVEIAAERRRIANLEEERLLSAISSICIGIGSDGSIQRWNQIAEETFGVPTATAIGLQFGELGIRWLSDGIEESLRHVGRHPTSLEGVSFRDGEGRVRYLRFTIDPVLDRGEPTGNILVLGRDETHRHELQTHLEQAQKLESIGQLAAGIAHEINTPTQYVGDNMRFLADAFGDLMQVAQAASGQPGATDDAGTMVGRVRDAIGRIDLPFLVQEVPRAIQQSMEGLSRVTEIVRGMKQFSHPGTGEKEFVDLNEAILATCTVARNEWKYVAELETDLDPELPSVPCVPGEINQVVLNLVVNAAHAIGGATEGGAKGKGRIGVSTRHDGACVELRVADTGTGIPEAIRHRVFDPFFTTKEVGKGTGQGLAIAHSVVTKKHSGEIWFASEEGKGTVFVVRLPLAPDPVLAEAAP